MSQIFELSIGPVQAFVGQARRTRDFWAGSFLLAWLAGVAIKSAQHLAADAMPVFPSVASGEADWVVTGLDGSVPPSRVARLSNHIRFRVPDTFDAAAVAADVKAAWLAFAKHVWEADFVGTDRRIDASPIYWRQVENLFEIAWTLDREPQLHRRKLWRTHARPAEPDLKCSVMAGLQELSGSVSHLEAAQFWRAIGDHTHEPLRPNERLSAPAWIKRRFATHFSAFQEERLPSGLTIRGSRLPSGVPSVSYIAAAPWLARKLATAKVEDIEKLVAVARELRADYREIDRDIDCVTRALQARTAALGSGFASAQLHGLTRLGGHVLFADSLTQDGRYSEDQAARLREALAPLCADALPCPFYAVLRMDADELGGRKEPGATAKALSVFTAKAINVVAQYSGFMVYGGGDDLLALLPLEFALGAAVALHETFTDSCNPGNPSFPMTASVAITYAHVKSPLTQVLRASVELLDEFAKDETGRDSLAIELRKSSGVSARWSMPWACALVKTPLTEARGGEEAVSSELALWRDIAQPWMQSEFSTGFLYRLGELLPLLDLPDGGSGGPELEIPPLAVDLVVARYRASTQTDLPLDQMRARVTALLRQLLPVRRMRTAYRHHEEVVYTLRPEAHYTLDAAVIARFLIQQEEHEQ